MQKLFFTLVSKKQLTHDVYELVFTSSEASPTKPGQYTLFSLPISGLKRAYSIAYTDGNAFVYIIKQLDGGVGSTEICSLPVGATLEGLSPLGHFVLRETEVPKLFIGTGTGFAPLYFMVRALEGVGSSTKAHFVFGVRAGKDRFYEEELDRIRRQYPDFSYRIYLSQDESEGCTHGRVTDFLTSEGIAPYSEFYLCGSPAMVKDARVRLEELGVGKEQVFFEQY